MADLDTRLLGLIDVGREDECWPHTGHRTFYMGEGPYPRYSTIRMAVWYATHGEWPPRVYTTCGIPKCCNPDHLTLTPSIRATLADRFWEKTQRGADDACWPWLGASHPQGYGRLWCPERGTHRVATHVSIWLDRGEEVPEDCMVMHTCDNPPCVNPRHLKVATYRENAEDCVRKLRSVWSPEVRARWEQRQQEEIL